MRFRLPAVLVAVVAGSVLAVTATSSAEAPLVYFDLQTKTVDTEGRARAVGTVQLQTNDYGKQRGVLKARLNDICPPDGYGAYLALHVYYKPLRSWQRYAEDVRGCEADSQDVVLRTPWDDRVDKIQVHLYEKDAGTGDIASNDSVVVTYLPAVLGG